MAIQHLNTFIFLEIWHHFLVQRGPYKSKKPAPERNWFLNAYVSHFCRNKYKKVLNHHSSKWVFAETFLHVLLVTCDRGLSFQLRYKTPYYSLKVKTLLWLRAKQLVFIYYLICAPSSTVLSGNGGAFWLESAFRLGHFLIKKVVMCCYHNQEHNHKCNGCWNVSC